MSRFSELVLNDLPNDTVECLHVLSIPYFLTDDIAIDVIQKISNKNNPQEILDVILSFPVKRKRSRKSWSIDDEIRTESYRGDKTDLLEKKIGIYQLFKNIKSKESEKYLLSELQDFDLQLARLALTIENEKIQEEGLNLLRQQFDNYYRSKNFEFIRIISKYINENVNLDVRNRNSVPKHLLNAFYMLGISAYLGNKKEEAIKYLNPVWKNASDYEQSLWDRAFAAYVVGVIFGKELRKWSDAEKAFQASIKFSLAIDDKALHDLIKQEYQSLQVLKEKDLQNQLQVLESSVISSLQEDNPRLIQLLFNQAQSIQKEFGNSLKLATILSNLGQIFLSQRNLESAKRSYEQALGIQQEFGESREMAISLFNLGQIYLGQGKLEGALKLYDQALSIQQKFGESREMATAFSNLGQIFLIQRNFENARQYYERALNIQQRFGESREMAISLSNLGQVFLSQGDFEIARQLSEQALRISERFGESREMAISLSNLGQVFLNQGEFERARQLSEQALKISKRIGESREMATAFSNLGQIFLIQRNFESARQYFEQALTIQRKFGKSFELASLLNETGVCLAYQENFTKAISFFEESREVSKVVNNLPLLGTIYFNLGQVHRIWFRNMKIALDYYSQAYKYYELSGNEAGMTETLNLIREVQNLL